MTYIKIQGSHQSTVLNRISQQKLEADTTANKSKTRRQFKLQSLVNYYYYHHHQH